MSTRDMMLVLVTVPDEKVGASLSRALVSEGLCACVNRSPGVHSIFRWQGKVEEAREEMLVIKTTRERFEELSARIRALHPYSVPEVLALPVAAGNPEYVDWVVHECRPEESSLSHPG